MDVKTATKMYFLAAVLELFVLVNRLLQIWDITTNDFLLQQHC